MSKFWKPFLSTAIPIVATNIIGIVSKVIAFDWFTADVSRAMGTFAAMASCTIAFVTSIPFAIMGKWEIVSGILIGLSIGVISLAATWPSILLS